MQGLRQKTAADGSSSNTRKLDRFTPLLADIRGCLGDLWTFYEECIHGLIDAAADKQDTTAWFEQLQQLVEGNDRVMFSHEGVLFLLHDMGIQPPKLQSWGEDGGNRGMYHSPPLSPPGPPEPTLSYVYNMTPMSAQPQSVMPSLLLHRPLRPNAPPTTNWAVQRARTQQPRQQQQQQQPQQRQQPTILHDSILPFDFSAPRQPGLTLPKDLRAFHYPPEQIVMTEAYIPPPPNPLRKGSSNPVFFADPAPRESVAELFGYPVQTRSDDRTDPGMTQQAQQRLLYDPSDDDLMAWRQRFENGASDESDGLRSNGRVSDTWPPWNFQIGFDL